MQNNCNPLIPWKTFLMRKIWRFSAPGKRNLGLVVPGADVAVPGLCLRWSLGILDSGHLSSSSSSSTIRRRRRQKRTKDGKLRWGRVSLGCVYRSEVWTLYGFVQFLLGFSEEMPPNPFLTNWLQPPHVPARSSIAHACPLLRLTSVSFPCGYVSASIE